MEELLSSLTRLLTRPDGLDKSTRSFLAQLPRAENPVALAR